MARITHGLEMHRDAAGGGLPWEEDPGDPGVGGRLQSGYSVVRSFAGDAYLVLNANLAALSSGDDTLILSANQETPGGGNDTKIKMLGGHGVVVPILAADPAVGASEDGQIYYDSGTNKFRAYQNGAWTDLIAGGGVDLSAINFLVGTASGDLSAEIVVGTTPGGELGGTWASPTVDTVHSGSAHPTFVGVRAYATSATSVNDSTWTSLTLDSERWDTNTFHDNATNNSRFTIPSGQGGKYLIQGIPEFVTNATGIRFGRILLNGTTRIGEGPGGVPGHATLGTRTNVMTVYDLAVGDYVEMQAWQNSGGPLNTQNTANGSGEFWMVKLG